MAKRFTDTEKWSDPWYMALPIKMKVAWAYLCDKCDGSGVWKINLELMSFYLGEPITEQDLLEGLGRRVVRVGEDRLWILGFIPFQYKTLKIKNHAHRGIMRQVVEMARTLPLDEKTSALIRTFAEQLSTDSKNDPHMTLNRPSTEGQVTPQVKAKVKVKGFSSSLNTASQCIEEWGATLKTFGIEKDPKLDEIPIARLIQSKTKELNGDPVRAAEQVRLALNGARYEARTETFNPADHVSVKRVGDHFEKFVNLAHRRQPKERKTHEVKITC